MSDLRVLMLLDTLAMGGAERSVLALTPALRVHGVEPIVATLSRRGDGALAEGFKRLGVRRLSLGVERLVDYGTRPWSVRPLLTLGVDVVHVQDPYAKPAALAVKVLRRIPVVVTAHVLPRPATSCREAWRTRALDGAGRFAADHVIAVSQAVRRSLIRDRCADPSRITVIYNGIALRSEDTAERRANLRRAFGWSEQERVVLMVAVLRPGKGHDVLFDALPAVFDSCPEARFVLVGDGELREPLERKARAFGRRVVFLGERTDVLDLMSASDVLVLPSRSEALPMALIEAGSVGCPAVAADVGGVCEIVEDGVSGYLVPPGDAEALARRIVEVVGDGALAVRLGSAARGRVARLFSIDHQASATAALYRRLVSRR